MAWKFNECPVCGSPVQKYLAPSEENLEGWDFFCGGSIGVHENGKLWAEDECHDVHPMKDAIDILNHKRTAA